MGITSKGSKESWINEEYVQVKVNVKPHIAAAFKATCLAEGVSMASQISGFMAKRGNVVGFKKIDTVEVITRGGRRKTIKGIIELLGKVLAMETHYMNNIPSNLQNSIVYETAEETISTLEEAVDLLCEAY